MTRVLTIDIGRWRFRVGRPSWTDFGEHYGLTKWWHFFGGRLAVHRGECRRWDIWMEAGR